jgi:epoxyqueuosine reductase
MLWGPFNRGTVDASREAVNDSGPLFERPRRRYDLDMTPARKSLCVKRLAGELGFDRTGIAPAAPVGRSEYYRRWLSEGRAGSMSYLHRYAEQRTDPRVLLSGARSVIVVASNYHQTAPPRPKDGRPRGRVARYAWGHDYHRVVKKKLFALTDRLRQTLDEPFDAKVCVDTAPLLEREFAAAAGIGWIGKNTMVLHPELGSYFFLGEIVTTLELACDAPIPDHCGSCTRCLDACPTHALHEPYQMDASLCVSYLTIEHRDEIPATLSPAVGDWVYGCDICQEVCPYNRDAPATKEPDFAVRLPGPYPILADLLHWSDDDYRQALRNSAMKRAKLPMLRRNARIALDNVSRGHPPVATKNLPSRQS